MGTLALTASSADMVVRTMKGVQFHGMGTVRGLSHIAACPRLPELARSCSTSSSPPSPPSGLPDNAASPSLAPPFSLGIAAR